MKIEEHKPKKKATPVQSNRKQVSDEQTLEARYLAKKKEVDEIRKEFALFYAV